jgi:predicted metal-dependent phosphoesterase TrpH
LTTRIDMHMHTVLGAYDSALKPARLATGARNAGLTAVAITEHDRMWDAHVLRTYCESESDLLVVNGMEVSTDMGHILAFGLPGFAPGIHRIADLRRIADEVGGYLAVAHPFRYWYEPVHFTRRGLTPPEMVPEVLARTPVFEYVDAIEVLNGANSDRENAIAVAVANYLGKPGIAGSDCHSETGIGCCLTHFERTIETPAQLVEELRAGRFTASYNPPRDN